LTGVPFQKFEKETKIIAKISNKNVWNHCLFDTFLIKTYVFRLKNGRFIEKQAAF